MSKTSQYFFRHVGQTSPSPLAIEVKQAKGSVLTDMKGKRYLDLIAGISVCNVGHCHPKVVRAIQKQSERYLHVLVYGELIESPQVSYARELSRYLPDTLDMVYFTNSGAEAIEGAMKLAKRITGRTQILAFKESYHGSTQGALSIMGDETWRNAFRPLLPDVGHLEYNSPEALDQITERTACVIAEPVQAERGVIRAEKKWMRALRKKCLETGTLLILDEIQTGFGRTGTLWSFQQSGIVPDILVLGKALGGGMPLGAFVAKRQLMMQLTHDPVLGHITTFGGHPVSCAAGQAAFQVLMKEKLMEKVNEKAALFVEMLQHPAICAVRFSGLLMAVELKDPAYTKQVIDRCIENGLLTDWFLFAPNCLRIAPPLTITNKQIRAACQLLIDSLQEIS